MSKKENAVLSQLNQEKQDNSLKNQEDKKKTPAIFQEQFVFLGNMYKFKKAGTDGFSGKLNFSRLPKGCLMNDYNFFAMPARKNGKDSEVIPNAYSISLRVLVPVSVVE